MMMSVDFEIVEYVDEMKLMVKLVIAKMVMMETMKVVAKKLCL